MFDENFQKFPPSPFDTRTSYESFEGRRVWLLGFESHVARRLEEGTVEVMDDTPAYSKVPHHIAFAYTEKSDPFLFGLPQMPIGAGSQLEHFELPAPYAYKLQGGFLFPFDWHWHNLAGLPRGEEVYLQLLLTLDDEDNGYRDVNYSHILTDETRTGEFCVMPGNNAYESIHYNVPQRMRVVLIQPHIHDHGYLIEMVLDDEVVLSGEPEVGNEYSYHVSHGGCPNTFWHRHDGHVKRTANWLPETDMILEPGSRLWVRTYYDNPHTDAEGRGIRIDGMGVLSTFWEVVP
jgi:hypothetical protein